jgi:AraC family transcriptional regulator of adaptative response / DNA-3-methyladenine glycosylase II
MTTSENGQKPPARRRYDSGMTTLDPDVCYRAVAARDPRFDGVFFVAVRSTRIYCRPICPVRTPQRSSCNFFATAAAAERAGYRPCLRCRPELAPGHAPVDAVGRLARAAAARIEAAAADDELCLEQLAAELGVSDRQLRRAVQREFGVSPVALAQTHRLLLAKKLLTETRLPMIDVAFASGFGSVRRFNHLFRTRYRLNPARFRSAGGKALPGDDRLRLRLAYRPPLAWGELLAFLGARATAGVEAVSGDVYARTVAIGRHRGWVVVRLDSKPGGLAVELPAALAPALPQLLARLRGLFDLDARPDVIDAHLSADARLAPLVTACPGLRVPGCFDGFELLSRAVLGQQVSVRAATTLSGRLAAAFGDPVEAPVDGLCRLFPTAERLAVADVGELIALGLTASRATCLRAAAEAVCEGRVRIAPAADPEAFAKRLCELPGVGDWTAQYVALRAARWPDAFPHGDLGLRKALGDELTPRGVLAAAEGWRPWRAYAAMHLWRAPAARPQRRKKYA